MFMFCKVNIFLFSTRLNMITASVGQWLVGRWVGGSVRKWSVVVDQCLVGWWSVDLIKAHQWRFSVQSLSSDHFLFKKFCAERKSSLTYNYSSLFFVHNGEATLLNHVKLDLLQITIHLIQNSSSWHLSNHIWGSQNDTLFFISN